MPDEEQDVTTSQGDNQQTNDQQSDSQHANPDVGHQNDAQDQGSDSKTDQSTENQRTEANRSSTNPIPVASNTQSSEQIDAEGYKRLRDQHSQLGRETANYRKQLETQRLELTRFQQEREKQNQAAAQQKLALHDYRHPEHKSKFVPMQAKADIVRGQLAQLAKQRPPEGLTPEQGQAWREQSEQMLMSSLSEEEQTTLAQFQQHNQNFQRQWATNPDQVLTERVIPMIRQEMQRAMRETQAASSVEQDMNDPELGPVMKEMGSEMEEAVRRLGGTDEAYDFVKQQAVVYAHNRKANDFLSQENARLKQQLETAGIRVGAAKAQQDLARGKASITRDISPKQTKPIYVVASEWAQQNNVDRSSAQFHQKIRELEGQAR